MKSRRKRFSDRHTDKEKQMILAAVRLKLEIRDIVSDFKDYWKTPQGMLIKKALQNALKIALMIIAFKSVGAIITFVPKLKAIGMIVLGAVKTFRIDNIKKGIIAFGVIVKSIEFLAKAITAFIESFKYKNVPAYNQGYGHSYGWDGLGY